jgi:hypothetical protein
VYTADMEKGSSEDEYVRDELIKEAVKQKFGED